MTYADKIGIFTSMEFPGTKLFTIFLPYGNSYQMILLYTLS